MTTITLFLLVMSMPALAPMSAAEVGIVGDHAEAVCPTILDPSLSDTARGKKITHFMRAQGYTPSQKLLFGRLCSMWVKGYAEGARRGPI